MATAPTGIRIRSYNVGFGDCFLLTFDYGSGRPRNVLIDFGSTKASKSTPSGGMMAIAEKIGEDCGGKLDIVVATHRHADHISGFGGDTGKVIAALEPELVIQPWTEEPDLDPKATGPADDGGNSALAELAVAARLSAMQSMAAAALAEVPRLRRSKGVTETVAKQIEFLGETNLANLDAVKNLQAMGKKNVYAYFGKKLALGRLLPGVGVDVLGPPTLKQTAAIAKQTATDAEEFWHLASLQLTAAEGKEGDGGELFPGAATAGTTPQEARWVIPRVDKMRGEEVLAIVRSLDSVLNNTSVILLFEVDDTRLVFPGDAQLENWHYALRECDEAEAIRERLADAAFYKVGHHGSLNATPKSLWNGFKHRDAKAVEGRLETMVSTLAGKHGSEKRGTEVPRKLLIEALETQSDLKNTQSLTSKKVFWNDTELKF